MLRDDPPCDGEAESSASQGAAARFIDAIEALENFVQLILGNSDAGVLYRNHCVPALLLEKQAHRAGRQCVFEGVIQKNAEHTPQGSFIAQNKQFSFFEIGNELQIADGGDLLPSLNDSAQSLGQIHWM